MPAENVHYNARLVVEKIVTINSSAVNRGTGLDSRRERRKIELTSVTVRSDMLDSLVNKIKAHADLVEDVLQDEGEKL